MRYPRRHGRRTVGKLTALIIIGIVLTGCSAPEGTPSGSASSAAHGHGVNIVGLGDSVPGGGPQCSAPCSTYPIVLGDLLATATGKKVRAVNDASNAGVTSSDVLDDVRSDAATRHDLREADVVTLTVGNNDLNDCSYWGSLRSCMDGLFPQVEANISKILATVTKLRAGKPTSIRVTNLYNTWVDIPTAPDDWSVPAADVAQFEPRYGSELKALGAGICKVATSHGAVCIDILTAFNGPGGDQAAGPLLMGDGIHPSAVGHQRIAQLIADAGVAELK